MNLSTQRKSVLRQRRSSATRHKQLKIVHSSLNDEVMKIVSMNDPGVGKIWDRPIYRGKDNDPL